MIATVSAEKVRIYPKPFIVPIRRRFTIPGSVSQNLVVDAVTFEERPL